MTEITFPKIPRGQVMYRYLPGLSMYNTQSRQSWRTTRLIGDAPTNTSQDLRRQVAQVINKIELSKFSQTSSGIQNSRLQQLAQQYGQSGSSGSKPQVSTEQIRLIVPTSMKVELFPLGLNCSTCNYFEIPDSRKLNLDCPNQVNGIHCSGTLSQVITYFICPQCGNTEEVSPFGKKLKGLTTFACPENNHGCGGTMLLNTQTPSFTNWKWICTKTGKQESVMKFCGYCKNRTGGKAPKMDLTNPFRSHSRILSMNFLLFGDQRTLEPTSPEWSISEFDPDQQRKKLFLSFGITNVEKFTEIQSSRVTFGTETYAGNTPKLFRKYNEQASKYEYDTYVTQNEGKGILISFDKKKLSKCVLEYVSKNDPNNAEISSYLSELKNCTEEKTEEIYEWVYKKSIETFDDPDSPFKQLFAVLHTLEHALSKHASLITGLDPHTFTGTVMMSLGAVLIYENEDVSAGGIDYLIDKKRIYEWIFESRRQIVNCENYCKDGCGKCVYCSDPLCHPVWSKELEKTYVNNNKLLARSLAAQFIDL